MHKIFYFSSQAGEQEFVVISDRSEADIKEEFSGEAALTESLEIHGDATSFPCDRVLTKE